MSVATLRSNDPLTPPRAALRGTPPKGERESFFKLAYFAVLAALLATPALAQGSVESFYAGKQLTLVVGADTGGGYDALGRLLSRHLADHIPGKPTIIVQNQPAAGSLVAANNLYNTAPKDGSVIGFLQRGMLIAHLTNPAGVHFEIAKFNWLGSLATETAVSMAWATAPVQKTEDIFTKELIIGGETGVDPETTPRVYNALIGTKFKIVTGYNGTTEIALAMERGEVQGIGDWSWSSFKLQRPTWLPQNKVNLLLQGALVKDPELPNLPNALDFVKGDTERKVMELFLAQKQAARPVLAPPGVPADRLAALRKAFTDMAADSAFKDDAAKAHLTVNPTSGDSITKVVELIATTPKPVSQKLTDILGVAK
jgi:tripartite-type tricarboxylate transporter receptor subunit TctC